MKAKFHGTTIAESDDTIIIEGNHYFPPDAVRMEFLKSSATPYTCPWKGESQYYDIVVNDEIGKDAAWAYPEPKPAAKEIAGYIAFWKDVQIA